MSVVLYVSLSHFVSLCLKAALLSVVPLGGTGCVEMAGCGCFPSSNNWSHVVRPQVGMETGGEQEYRDLGFDFFVVKSGSLGFCGFTLY